MTRWRSWDAAEPAWARGWYGDALDDEGGDENEEDDEFPDLFGIQDTDLG